LSREHQDSGGGTGMTTVARISRHFRHRRMRWFCSAMGITASTRILDVGGSPDTWMGLPFPPCVTLVNIPMSITSYSPGLPWVAGDGCSLPFRDGAFDIVFSNSVIEHVGNWQRQLAFARETMRVGKRYFVQTPNRAFPIEQHLFLPLVHWLPRRWQRAVVWRFTPWEWITRPRTDQREFYLRHFLEDVRLLGASDLRQLFPGARVHRERLFGIAKSLVAMLPPSA